MALFWRDPVNYKEYGVPCYFKTTLLRCMPGKLKKRISVSSTSKLISYPDLPQPNRVRSGYEITPKLQDDFFCLFTKAWELSMDF